MKKISNPFLSDNFTSVWSKHFNQSKPENTFHFAPNLGFTKHHLLPLFINVGKTLTKGIEYSLSSKENNDYRRNAFLIYDVPTYFEIEQDAPQSDLGFYKTKQYPGFLINLEEFKDLTQYMAVTFSKSSRYKLNKYKKRLEQCFDIEYRMFFGNISKKEYDEVFKSFRMLLEKRFDDKQIENNNLRTDEWNFYYEVAFPMILEKKASLFVIYDSGSPIGVTLNYFSDTVVFDAITVFDIDYSKFHLGSVTIMKLVEWSILNGYSILDFSKGYFDYKTRWSNKAYDFEYHIYYDSSSLKAKSIALFLKKFFDLKQYLRDKKINEKLHRITYRLKRKTSNETFYTNYTFIEVADTFDIEKLESLNTKMLDDRFLKSIAFDFLYLNNECMTDLKMYEFIDGQIDYLLLGRSKKMGVSITK